MKLSDYLKVLSILVMMAHLVEDHRNDLYLDIISYTNDLKLDNYLSSCCNIETENFKYKHYLDYLEWLAKVIEGAMNMKVITSDATYQKESRNIELKNMHNTVKILVIDVNKTYIEADCEGFSNKDNINIPDIDIPKDGDVTKNLKLSCKIKCYFNKLISGLIIRRSTYINRLDMYLDYISYTNDLKLDNNFLNSCCTIETEKFEYKHYLGYLQWLKGVIILSMAMKVKIIDVTHHERARCEELKNLYDTVNNLLINLEDLEETYNEIEYEGGSNEDQIIFPHLKVSKVGNYTKNLILSCKINCYFNKLISGLIIKRRRSTNCN